MNETGELISNLSGLSFVSNGQSFSSILKSRSGFINGIAYDNLMVATGTTISLGVAWDTWTDQAYRTVTFSEPPTGELLTWLQANGVKQ